MLLDDATAGKPVPGRRTRGTLPCVLAVLNTIRAMAAPAADLLLPRHCEACGCAAEGWLCESCSQMLETLVAAPRCGTCAYPLPHAQALCARCGGHSRRVIGRYARLGTHTGVLRDLVLKLKFARRWPLVEELGTLLAREPFAATVLAEADVIVPVPLHWWRQMRRGYNQSELLARAIAKVHGKPVVQALRRVRYTQTQSAVHSLTARARNMKNAFAARGNVSRLTGKRVVLVDDVMTSGATLREAARALRTARPAQVDAITLSIADPKGRDFILM